MADKVTDVTQQAVGGALSHVGATPDSAAANVAHAATSAAVETGVNAAADAAADTASTKGSGEE